MQISSEVFSNLRAGLFAAGIPLGVLLTNGKETVAMSVEGVGIVDLGSGKLLSDDEIKMVGTIDAEFAIVNPKKATVAQIEEASVISHAWVVLSSDGTRVLSHIDSIRTGYKPGRSYEDSYRRTAMWVGDKGHKTAKVFKTELGAKTAARRAKGVVKKVSILL